MRTGRRWRQWSACFAWPCAAGERMLSSMQCASRASSLQGSGSSRVHVDGSTSTRCRVVPRRPGGCPRPTRTPRSARRPANGAMRVGPDACTCRHVHPNDSSRGHRPLTNVPTTRAHTCAPLHCRAWQVHGPRGGARPPRAHVTRVLGAEAALSRASRSRSDMSASGSESQSRLCACGVCFTKGEGGGLCTYRNECQSGCSMVVAARKMRRPAHARTARDARGAAAWRRQK